MEDRVGLWLTAAAAVIVVLAAVFYLVLALQWRSQPFPGVLLTRTLTVDGSLPLAPEGWAGLNAGLQRGDHIIGINGDDVPVGLRPRRASLRRADAHAAPRRSR